MPRWRCELVAPPKASDAIFVEAAKMYPGYAHYRQRAEHRKIRVFVLESAG